MYYTENNITATDFNQTIPYGKGIQYGEANLTLAQKYAFTKKFTIFTQSL